MNILGIGQAGCRMTKQFENFPQYNTFFIDVKNEGSYKNFFTFHDIKMFTNKPITTTVKFRYVSKCITF